MTIALKINKTERNEEQGGVREIYKTKRNKNSKRVAVKQIEALNNSKVLLPEFS